MYIQAQDLTQIAQPAWEPLLSSLCSWKQQVQGASPFSVSMGYIAYLYRVEVPSGSWWLAGLQAAVSHFLQSIWRCSAKHILTPICMKM